MFEEVFDELAKILFFEGQYNKTVNFQEYILTPV